MTERFRCEVEVIAMKPSHPPCYAVAGRDDEIADRLIRDTLEPG
jgi:hypothetical protein